MFEQRDIVAVSIPFSAGVITAVYLPLGSVTLSMAAALCCIATGFCLTFYCRKGNNLAWGFALFYLLGSMVGFGASLAEPFGKIIEADDTSLPKQAFDGLLQAIDGLSIDNEQVKELAKALLTGNRSGLSPSTIASFRAAGASHILSLSGLHIGIIYGILQKALLWMGRSPAASVIRSLCIIAAAAFYTRMTGSPPSVMRAFLFISINELSRMLPGRRRRPIAVFCGALMIQLLANPLIIKSVGFQLSYLAMLGIVLLFPYLDAWVEGNSGSEVERWSGVGVVILNERGLEAHQEDGRDAVKHGWQRFAARMDGVFARVRKRLWSAASLSISCQLFTAPLVMLYFKSFPHYFLLTNLIAVPLTELFVICLIVSLLAQWIFPTFVLPARISHTIGTAIIKALEIIATM